MKEEKVKTDLMGEVVVGVLCLILGLVAGTIGGFWTARDEAIEHGYASFVLNEKTGDIEFKWKEEVIDEKTGKIEFEWKGENYVLDERTGKIFYK